jgi:hypothetical protein
MQRYHSTPLSKAGGVLPSPGSPKVPLYTCRGGSTEGYGLQVGKFTPGSTGCDFGYGGAEISVLDFQFLVTSWQAASGGLVPSNAVQGGWDTPPPGSSVKPPLYFCRVKIKAGTTRPALLCHCSSARSGRALEAALFLIQEKSSP